MASSSCRCCSWISTPVLLLLCITLFQWLLLTFLLSRQETMNAALSSLHSLGAVSCALCPAKSIVSRTNAKTFHNKTSPLWDGVAVGLMLRRPKWFYKRYNVMIHNAMVNTLETWAIQLMVHPAWFEGELLHYHRGLKRLVESNHSRIIVTPLPEELRNLKPKQVLPTRWFWQHVVAERVLLFHGDGALCSNTKKTWSDFEEYAYVGVPWSAFDKYGGSGTEFSLRSRSAMLAALDYKPFPGGQEDKYFVSTLLEMNKDAQHDGVYKIATPQVTQWFAGTQDIVGDNNTLMEDESFGPMVVSGTQGHLSDAVRNWILGTCPEIKAVFPVLHNPNCFGARPKPAECSHFITGIRRNNTVHNID